MALEELDNVCALIECTLPEKLREATGGNRLILCINMAFNPLSVTTVVWRELMRQQPYFHLI